MLIGCGGAAPAPAPFAGLLTAGAGHTCVAGHDGTVSCWGSNPDGQLGIGSEMDSWTPAPVPGLAGVREVVAGSYHTCARGVDASVSCWGWNVGGQVGDGSIA